MVWYVNANHCLPLAKRVQSGSIPNFPSTDTFPLTLSSHTFASSVCCNSLTFCSAVFNAADPIPQSPPNHPPPPASGDSTMTLGTGAAVSAAETGFSTTFSGDFFGTAGAFLAKSRLVRDGVPAGRGVCDREGCFTRSSRNPNNSFSFSLLGLWKSDSTLRSLSKTPSRRT